jgi:hypothetical protein
VVLLIANPNLIAVPVSPELIADSEIPEACIVFGNIYLDITTGFKISSAPSGSLTTNSLMKVATFLL